MKDVKLSESIRPYLFDLKDNFTSFELLSALRLTSKHAKRIYTLCSRWKDLGETKEFSLLDFKKMLGLVDAKRSTQAIASLSRPGNPYDNALAESGWSTLKTELLPRGACFADPEEARFELAIPGPLLQHETTTLRLGLLHPARNRPLQLS